MRTSKNICVFCGYALVAGLSRGYTCICGQGVAHAAVEGSQRAVRRAQPSWWPEARLDFVGRARPTHVLSPRRHSPEAEGSLGGSSSSSMQRASSRRSAGQRLKVCGAPCVAGARGRPARRAVRANMHAARPGLRVLASASRRPARPQRPRHASRVAADPPFALPFTIVFNKGQISL